MELRDNGIEIGEIASLRLREGDMLVLQARTLLTPQQAERLRKIMKSSLLGIKVVVLEEGLTMTHVQREEGEA